MICFEKIQKNVWNLNTYASSHFPSITCEIRLQKQVLTSICHKMWQVNAGYVIFFYDITCIMKGGKFYPINPPRHPEKQYTRFSFNQRQQIMNFISGNVLLCSTFPRFISSTIAHMLGLLVFVPSPNK